MKRFILVLVAVCGLLAFTNPSQADHRRAVADSFNAENPIIGFFNGGKVASALVGYDSYVLFSVGRLGDQPISVGLLGKVFAKEIPIESELWKALRGSGGR